MKISKRTREQAAPICAIAASSESPSWTDACQFAGSGSARLLAESAAGYAITRSFHSPVSIYYAEAEALLHTGWSPCA